MEVLLVRAEHEPGIEVQLQALRLLEGRRRRLPLRRHRQVELAHAIVVVPEVPPSAGREEPLVDRSVALARFVRLLHRVVVVAVAPLPINQLRHLVREVAVHGAQPVRERQLLLCKDIEVSE